ncbi:MAG TPA: DUF86 domain-containing protein [Smithellaceae bacterium]|nr:DUF86 domain-containing protein [Smithellaceae bacterium]HRS90066.1 DUF86 domain-containing protein [Smithellaceae bacterium]HRV26916.1 DUF86 domain-containing protein [Smithellaceae bacterium]
MTRHNDDIRLRHILDHAQEALVLTKGKGRPDLDIDRKLELALTRLLEIIGEAANLVPEKMREQHQQIPWRQMISLRNRLIHGYDAVDKDILWDIICQDLPPLIKSLKSILGEK